MHAYTLPPLHVRLVPLAIACIGLATAQPLIAQASDLAPLSSTRSACRAAVQDSARARRGLATMFSVMDEAPTRYLTVGVDASNRLRVFGSMMTQSSGQTLAMHGVSAVFDSLGHMSMPTRTFTTRQLPEGTGESKSVRLTDAETTAVRALAVSVLQRCIP